MEDQQDNTTEDNSKTPKQETKFAPKYEVAEGFVRFCPGCGRNWKSNGNAGEEITCGWMDCQIKFQVFKL